MEMVEKDFVIIGAGIAGLASAVALKRLGINAYVLEKSDSLRATGAALTLFPNAWLALDALGVSHKLTSIYAPTTREFVTNLGTGATKEISFAGTSGHGSGPRSVHRKTLLEALAGELPVDTIRFSSKITLIETQTHDGSSIAILRLGDGTIIKAKVLIGCDGIHSTVARWLGLSELVNSGRSSVRGMAVFPEGHELNQEVRQFVDVGIRAGFVPLNDKDVYWFFNCKSPPKDIEGVIFLSTVGDGVLVELINNSSSNTSLQGENIAENPELIQKEVLEMSKAKKLPQIYLDIVHHCDLSTLTWVPLMFRNPWNILFGNLNKGSITVAGDAMHPMTPDLGQGGCSALEDAVVLGRHVGDSLFVRGGNNSMAQAFDGYVKERKWRVTWLVIGSFLSGWVQQGGSNGWMKFLRDVVFYRFLFGWIVNVACYDCGQLPSVPFGDQLDNQSKID